MFNEFEKQARRVINKILAEKGIDVKIKSIDAPTLPYGDLSTSVCYDLAPKLKKSPKEVAEDFVSIAKVPEKGVFKEIRAINGYINFYLNYEKIAPELIRKITKERENFGRGKKKGKFIIEHTSANPNGPLHIGHARNAIIGDTLARIMRFAGYDVETHYYLNDMGKQVAMVVWGLRKFKSDAEKGDDRIADIYIQANKAVEQNPEFDAEIAALMKFYEEGREDIKKEFEKAVNLCLEGIRETLHRIRVTHDRVVWESRFARDSSVKKVMAELEKSKYARREEVLYLDLRDFGIDKELIMTREDGTSLYTTRDIAYHLWKMRLGGVINIWGADHKLAAKQLVAALKILGREVPPDFIIHEFISLPEGSMSTRKGVFVSLDDLISECTERAYREVDERRKDTSEEFKRGISESVGIGAIRFNIIKVSPEKSMTFRWEEALDFDRQGSPFIQYAYARACRILEKAELDKDFKVHKLSEHEKELVKTLSQFPRVVEEATETRRPAIIASYALKLANAFHKFYKFDPVLKSNKRAFRINLVQATKVTLGNAFNLLGIDALEAM